MKYQDFSSDENLVSSEDTIFIFHTVKISLPDFLDQLFTHFPNFRHWKNPGISSVSIYNKEEIITKDKSLDEKKNSYYYH